MRRVVSLPFNFLLEEKSMGVKSRVFLSVALSLDFGEERVNVMDIYEGSFVPNEIDYFARILELGEFYGKRKPCQISL
ncbi:MAG: hypothetical protein M0Z77_05840 [Thermoplasmatales archaeon]|nr:hypothetical protein [Thermoplasmatales archaeon]